MIVLKCDTCEKEIEMAFEISINQRPYTVSDMFKREQLKPITTKSRCLCDECYEEVMRLIYPQGDEE